MRSLRLGQRLVQLGFLVAVALAWHLATAWGQVSPLLLPPIASVYREFILLFAAGAFWPDLGVTIFELVVAFLIAACCGTVTGYLVSRSTYATKVFDPLFSGIYSIPAILLFPLYVLVFGLGPASKIAIGTTIAFFPITLSTIAGFRNVDRIYVTAARSMGASSRQLFMRVMLQAAFPVIFAGLRMGLSLAFLSILGAETIASLSGLGHRIVELGENMETTEMFAYIIFVILVAFFLNSAVAFAENRRSHA
jgi:ABC-type nitrate/sulfonate/bicarbonate transport system permease component